MKRNKKHDFRIWIKKSKSKAKRKVQKLAMSAIVIGLMGSHLGCSQKIEEPMKIENEVNGDSIDDNKEEVDNTYVGGGRQCPEKGHAVPYGQICSCNLICY